MAIRSGGQGAYAPPANILQAIEAYRSRGLQRPITDAVLTRAGIPETVAKRTVNSMVVLDLIDEQGNPTDALEALRLAPSPEFPARLRAMVEGAYSEILTFANPATDDPDRILDAFRGVEPMGQMRRMVTLFLGLAEAAGMIPDGAPAKPGAKPPQIVRTRTARPTGTSRTAKMAREQASDGARVGDHADATVVHTKGLPPAIGGLLASLPRNGDGWTKEERKRWFEVFTTVVDFSIPVTTSKKVEAGEDDE
jgi:hypothetical protein